MHPCYECVAKVDASVELPWIYGTYHDEMQRICWRKFRANKSVSDERVRKRAVYKGRTVNRSRVSHRKIRCEGTRKVRDAPKECVP